MTTNTTAQLALTDRLARQQAWLVAASALASAYGNGECDRDTYRSRLADLHRQGASVRFLAAATGRPSSSVGDDIIAGRAQ